MHPCRPLTKRSSLPRELKVENLDDIPGPGQSRAGPAADQKVSGRKRALGGRILVVEWFGMSL